MAEESMLKNNFSAVTLCY